MSNAETTMLEKCARAASKAAGNFDYDGFGPDTKAKYDRIARAVLQAIAEPTPGMIDAAVAPYRHGNTEQFNTIYREAVVGYWRAMLQAAEGPEP